MAKILIVDEVPGNRRLTVSLLRNHGHSVLGASNDAEAVSLVRSESPDLMVVDILAPGADGCEFVLTLRAEADLVQPRLLLRATANNEAEARALAHAFGAAFVVKPTKSEML